MHETDGCGGSLPLVMLASKSGMPDDRTRIHAELEILRVLAPGGDLDDPASASATAGREQVEVAPSFGDWLCCTEGSFSELVDDLAHAAEIPVAEKSHDPRILVEEARAWTSSSGRARFATPPPACDRHDLPGRGALRVWLSCGDPA